VPLSSTFLLEIDKAISRGLNFLSTKQYADGLWRDFETLAGASSDWVSAFVSYAISNNLNSSKMILPTHNSLMRRQRFNGGWSYNRSVPTDCDSTAWALLALSTNSHCEISRIQRGLKYIESHHNPNTGGFSTYIFDDGIDRFLQMQEKYILNGWYNVQVDVTSVVVQSLLASKVPIDSKLVQKAVSYLIKQRKEGNYFWNSYWWKGYAYSTFHALRALIMCKFINEEEIHKTIEFLLSSQQKDGGWNDSFEKKSEIFGTAFTILCLLLYINNETLASIKKGISWILSKQNSDGSWPTVPILKIPPPFTVNPALITKWRNNQLGTGVIIEDKGRVFTTAATLWALMSTRSIKCISSGQF
jgi:squalene cyclase